MTKTQTISVSIGIFCHNEENNVGHALASILASKTKAAQIKEIVVVSSGSFDRTNQIVRTFCRKDKRIRLIDEVERSGKSSAINQFLRIAKGRVLVSMSGDLRVKSDAIEEIVEPFLNDQVGMVGAHPVPTNCRFSEVGRETKLLWELHHRISLQRPKCGEMIAFRNVIHQIPNHASVDEATLEVLLRLIGFSIMYAPRSIVYNKVPLTLREYVMRRRTVEAGHLWLMSQYNYRVVTLQNDQLFHLLLGYLLEKPSELWIVFRLVVLELASRFLGWFDFSVMGKNPYIWQMAKR